MPLSFRSLLPCAFALALPFAGGVSLHAQGAGNSLDFATSQPVPHGMHTPQHNGIFFMALDNTHHLEGVLLKSGVFRVYLYDVFTKPLPAAEVQGASGSVQVGESESAPQIHLAIGKDGHTLEAPLGKDLRLPVAMNLYLRFRDAPPEQRPEVFTFRFSQYIVPDGRQEPPRATETSFLILYIYFCVFVGGGAGIWIVRRRMAAQVGAHIREEEEKRGEIPPKGEWKSSELFPLWRAHRKIFPVSLLRYSYMTLWALTVSWLFFGLSLLRRMNLQ